MSEKEILYPFWGRKHSNSSPVWEHFGFKLKEGENELDKNTAYCKYCLKGLGYSRDGSTTSMRFHVERHVGYIGDNNLKLLLPNSEHEEPQAMIQDENPFMQEEESVFSKIKIEPNSEQVIRGKNSFDPRIPDNLSETIYKREENSSTNPSIVWESFGFKKTEDGSLYKKMAFCRLCGKGQTYNHSTSALLRHLETQHEELGMVICKSLKRKNGGRKKTRIWEHFLEIEKDGKIIAKCTNCGNEQSSKPSRMQSHYEKCVKKNVTPVTLVSQQTECTADSTIEASRVGTKSKITDKEQNSKHSEISSAIRKYIVLDLQPLNTLDSEGFTNLVGVLNPLFAMENSCEVQKKIDELYKQEENKLKQLLEGIKEGAITLEIWAEDDYSKHSTVYLSVELYFVAKNWKLVKCLLNTVPLPDTAPTTISEIVQKILNDWDLSSMKVLGVVGSDTNIRTALKHSNICYVGCIGDIINHAATQAMSSSEILNTIDSVKEFFRLFVGNSQLNELLHQLCGHHFMKFNFASQNFTPWYTTYKSLANFGKLKVQLRKLFQLDEIVNIESISTLSENEFEIIKDIVEELSLLHDIVESLCSEGNPTASSILPILYQLTDVYIVQDEDSNTARVMKNNIKTLLQSMDISQDEDMRKELFLATMLDPRFKSLWFLSYSEQSKIYQRLIDVALEISSSENDEENDQLHPKKKIKLEKDESHDLIDVTPNKGAKGLASIFSRKKDKSLNSSSALNEFSAAEIEVELYKAEEQIPMDSDPYKWWQIREVKYSLLSQLARRYLCLPACALQPNFLFTSAGAEYNAKRQMLLLSNEDVKKRLFLHKALKE